MGRSYTAWELDAKIGYEGGIVDALEYGIVREDIEDPELAALWGELEDVYEYTMRPVIVLIERRLSAAERPSDEG